MLLRNILLKQLTWSAARHSHCSTSTSCSHCRCYGSSARYEENMQQTRTTKYIHQTHWVKDRREGLVIYDHYLDQSLKAKTRQREHQHQPNLQFTGKWSKYEHNNEHKYRQIDVIERVHLTSLCHEITSFLIKNQAPSDMNVCGRFTRTFFLVKWT